MEDLVRPLLASVLLRPEQMVDMLGATVEEVRTSPTSDHSQCFLVFVWRIAIGLALIRVYINIYYIWLYMHQFCSVGGAYGW